MNLTLSQLECFVATLEAGSFTGAAETLGVSQPAVAEQIQRLEGAVGRSLFARQVRGVRPTPAALELEPDARRALDGARAVSSMASTANTIGAGSVAFGTFGSPHHYGLARSSAGSLPIIPGRGFGSSATIPRARPTTFDRGPSMQAVVALPVDAAGLEVRPLFVGEVVMSPRRSRSTRRPVSIETMASSTRTTSNESSAGIAGSIRPGASWPHAPRPPASHSCRGSKWSPRTRRLDSRPTAWATRTRRNNPAAFARSSSEHAKLRTPARQHVRPRRPGRVAALGARAGLRRSGDRASPRPHRRDWPVLMAARRHHANPDAGPARCSMMEA